MTAKAFVEKLLDIANNTKTIYILGCFGAPMNVKNKTRYSNNNTFNKANEAKIHACSSDTFGFDCVGLIKGVLWGWDKDVSKTYGGATYKANGVPDVGANSMMNNYCKDVSTDFTKIEVGSAVWIDGHIGVYIGDGKVVEATSRWSSKVLISSLGNLGYKGVCTRTWTKWGKLPWIDYSVKEEKKEEPKKEEPKKETPIADDGKRYHIATKGQGLSKIGAIYGVSTKKMKELNPQIKPPFYIVKLGAKIRIK